MRRPGPILALLAVIFIGLLLAIFYAEAVVAAFRQPFAARPGPDGEVTILLDDFRFSPSVIRVKAGQKVRLRLRNVGRHTHEFMVGRAARLEDDIWEPPAPDFFEGLADVRVEVVRGSAMPMGFEGMEEMEMGGMKGEEPMGKEGEMGGMEMGEGMTGPGIHAEGMVMEMDDLHGSMVMLDPMAEVIIEFTVPPDKVGTWVFGCFQEEGLHFDGGMRGLLIVEP